MASRAGLHFPGLIGTEAAAQGPSRSFGDLEGCLSRANMGYLRRGTGEEEVGRRPGCSGRQTGS